MPSDIDRLRTNLVPRDFVIDAIAALSTLSSAAGVTYQLADGQVVLRDYLGDIGEG